MPSNVPFATKALNGQYSLDVTTIGTGLQRVGAFCVTMSC
jgi:hypothetical protein